MSVSGRVLRFSVRERREPMPFVAVSEQRHLRQSTQRVQLHVSARLYRNDCQTVVDECSSYPCRNNATCTGVRSGYACVCATGFTGTNCQTNIDECLSVPCLNNGTCTDRVAGYSCVCSPPFTGVLCQTKVNQCSSGPCRNNGTCLINGTGFSCVCAVG